MKANISESFLASSGASLFSGLKAEIIRKLLHFSIALSPTMAFFNKPLTVAFLITGTLSYTYMEYLRLSGVKIPFVSSITRMTRRPRDTGFVMGPVTLGIGALLALLFYPSPAAAIGIYALAFGDGIASLVGRFFGSHRPEFLLGKSVEGSLACFAAVFLSAYAVSGRLSVAMSAAFIATAVEALPLEDYDNMAIPVAVGFVVNAAMM